MNDFTIGILLAVGQFILVGVLSLLSRPKVATVYAEPEPVAPRRPRSAAPVVAVHEVAELEPVAVEVAPIEEPAPVIVAYGETEKSQTHAPAVSLATPEPVAVGAKPLQGMTFCITGKIGVRREEFGAFIERQGGTWHRNARKDTQYIIVGHTGEYGTTGKLRTAIENGAQEITAEEVAALCGTTMEALRDDDATYEAAATHHATRELRKAQRSIERQAAGITQSIRIEMQSRECVTFAHSVPVMVEGGEVARCTSIELHRPTSNRLEYIIRTDEGEALSLEEVHHGFMGDILDAILTAA
jgi:hypothetical protein